MGGSNMNRLWIGLVVLGAIPFAMAQTDGSAAGPPAWDVNVVKSPAVIEYRVVGETEAETTGNSGGIASLHGLCQEEYGSEARACTSVEVIRSPEIANLSLTVAWVQPVIVSQGVIFDPTRQRFSSWMTDATGVVSPSSLDDDWPHFAAATVSLSCNGWTSEDLRDGLVLRQGKVSWAQCVNEHPVLCCAPRP
jgi:hypothetical protein